MATKQLTSEEDLAELLAENDIETFFEFLEADYSEKIIAYISRVGLGWLDEDEKGIAYQNTLIAFWQATQKPDFEPERPLRLMFRIARNKALDVRRKKARRTKWEITASTADLILDDLAGSNLRIDVKVANEEEKRRFDEALPEVIAGLSPQQQAAATAFLECYEELRKRDKFGPIAEIMSKLTGEDVTPGAAKSALRGAMENIRKELVRRGIGFLKGSTNDE